MSRKKGRQARARAEPAAAEKTGAVAVCMGESWKDILCSGYTSLAQNPEITTAVDTVARLMGSMTIHLMENTEAGDVRVRNELARKVDIEPNRYMTRANFVYWIVKTVLLEGGGNAVVWPKTRKGYLQELVPIPPGYASFLPDGRWGYRIAVAGREYDPDDLLHFAVNPNELYPWKGDGYRVALKDVAENLKQAAQTTKGFMKSKWKPSIIVKVDAMGENFSTPEGRKKVLENYVETAEAGEPWLVPAEQFDVKEIRPLSLSDLALADFVKLDKSTVASILGVPPFVLGVGEFRRESWNNFISTRIMPLAKIIEQELTRKLLYAPDWYFRFNARSLYNYDLSALAKIGTDLYVRGIMDGNEVRDLVGFSPREGLDQLVLLENYIPLDRIGDQAKLQGGDDG